MNNPKLWPYILVGLCGIIWGSTFSLARMATTAGAHPLGLTFWQGLGGGIVLLVIYMFRRRWPVLTLRHCGLYLFLGLLGTAGPGALYFYAATHVPAGVLAITIATVPLMTYGGSWLLRIEAFSPRRMAGIGIGLLAIVLILAPDASPLGPSIALWILLALLACLAYTIENIYIAMRIPHGTDMIALLCGMLFAAALAILPLVLAKDAFVSIAFPWSTAQWCIVAMSIVSSVAYAMFLYLIQLAGPVFAAQTGYVITLSGVFWGIAIFGEAHSYWVWLALGLILIGFALVTPRRVEQQLAEV